MTKALESLFSNRNVRLLQKSTQVLAKEAALKDAEKIRASKSKFFVTYRLELLRYKPDLNALVSCCHLV